MPLDAATQVGKYRLTRKLVERQWLTRSGMKIPNQVAYCRVWVVEKPGPEDSWAAVKYFDSNAESEAREWAEANPDT